MHLTSSALWVHGQMSYKPIANYGVIGDMETAALVGLDGSIDWLCLPRFDSPSVFAAILDENRGGCFSIAPCAKSSRCQQLYKPDTNILVTRFLTAEGTVELTDFLPVRMSFSEPHRSRLIRRVKAVSGSASLKVKCVPALQYATQSHETQLKKHGALFQAEDLSVELATTVPLSKSGVGVESAFTLKESQSISFVLGVAGDIKNQKPVLSEGEIDELEEDTASYWRSWLGRCSYKGRWREMVRRSALLLELLTYAPSGAIVAAPSCSLPETIGGERNWDYRYNWIRDAAYAIYAQLRIGLFDEATRFIKWVEERCAELADGGALQTVYAVDGARDLHEQEIKTLEGYRGSAPVRVGNNAFKQVQLDIYGALIDAVYLYNKYVEPVTTELWRDVSRLVDWVCDNWQQEDRGIWELRENPGQLVHSKVMCWVAVDRGLRLAMKRSLPADEGRWLKCRNQIYQEVLSKGWNSEKKSFVQRYDGDKLDASVLMMPLVFFLAPNDPLMASTVDAICKPVSEGGLMFDGMLYRYESSAPNDGLPPGEGTFNVCSLWLVETLTRMGRLQDARWLFEKVLTRANHIGLYSEETSAVGEQVGNFPQAFTHMGLISAAFNLDRALDSPIPVSGGWASIKHK